MTAAPEGATVTITYDAEPWVEIAAGHGLVARTGRTYLILEARRVRSSRLGRWRLRCLVVDGAAAKATTFHPLVWNLRPPRRWRPRAGTRT